MYNYSVQINMYHVSDIQSLSLALVLIMFLGMYRPSLVIGLVCWYLLGILLFLLCYSCLVVLNMVCWVGLCQL